MRWFGRKRSRTTGLGIGIEAAIILAIEVLAAHLLVRANLLEHLLSPGAGSRLALAIVALFLLLRGFVYVCLPGWLLARLFLLLTRPPKTARGGMIRAAASAKAR